MPLVRKIDPSIDPSDTLWEKVHAAFTYEVRSSEKTLGDILLDNFSIYEIRQFFHQGRKDLRALQEQNAERYRALLATRFKGYADDVPTKLAMMFFGLPVEPVQAPPPADVSRALAALQVDIAQTKPLAFLEGDELSQVKFGDTSKKNVSMIRLRSD